MPRNTIIVGFDSEDQAAAIKKCEKNELFTIKTWISNQSQYSDFITHDFDAHRIKPIHTHHYNKYYQQIFDNYFHIFTESLIRGNHIDFSYFEFKNLFTIQFYFFYDLIKDNRIELLIASNFLHEADFLLYPIAKDIFNIQTIFFNQSLFPNRFWYMDSIEDYGDFSAIKQLTLKTPVKKSLLSELRPNLFYMKKSKKFSFKEGCFYKYLFKNFEKIFNKKRNIQFSTLILKYKKCKIYNNMLLKYSTREINFNETFVYFPLHLQPELTTSIFGNIHSDQLLAIEKLSEFIPKEWKIYVKENPKQNYFQRDPLFFKRLLNINKVVLVDKRVDTHKLTQHCQFLSTISGTAGWEAIIEKRKVLLFGYAWYQTFPGVFTYNKELTFDMLNNSTIYNNQLEEQFEKFLSNMFLGIIDENYTALVKNFNKQENKENIIFALQTILTHHESK